MKYSTQQIHNLSTGQPLEVEMAPETLKRLEDQLNRIATGQGSPLLGTAEELRQNYELAALPSFKKVVKGWMGDCYSNELLDEILQDFGVTPEFREKLLENEEFTGAIKPWFHGICQDGGRAARTLGIIYHKTQSYFEA